MSLYCRTVHAMGPVEMFRQLTSRGRGRTFQLLCGHVTLWVIAFQVTSVFSQASNAPGYIGCFMDSNDRVFETGPKESKKQSVEQCFKYCLDRQSGDFKYAGLEHADECFCGTADEDIRKHGQEHDTDCSDRCKGNRDQICGDGWRLSIYIISQGVCSNDTGPPTNGNHTITNPRSLSYNLNNFKFFRTRVDFSCDTGYTLHGASSIECINTGYNNVTWNDTVPRCEATTQTTEIMTSLPAITTISRTIAGELQTTTLAITSRGKTSRVPVPPPTGFTMGVVGTNAPQVGSLGTGTIIGIVAGILIALVLLLTLLILLRRKGGKEGNKSSDVAMATIGSSYRNNTYGLPDVTHQSHVNGGQSDQPVYSNVIRKKPADNDDVYAVPDDVKFQSEQTARDTQQPGDCSEALASSPNGEETEWVDNTLYGCEEFPTESQSIDHNDSGKGESPETMEEQSEWVENIIYE